MGHKPKNKNKDNKPANAWLTGHPNDEFDRQQFMRTFSGAPITVPNLLRYLVREIDEGQYQHSSVHVLHAAVGATAAETLRSICEVFEDCRTGPREVWDAMVALARANALLLAKGYVEQTRSQRMAPPHEFVKWAETAWGPGPAAEILDAIAPGLLLGDAQALDAWYEGPADTTTTEKEQAHEPH